MMGAHIPEMHNHFARVGRPERWRDLWKVGANTIRRHATRPPPRQRSSHISRYQDLNDQVEFL
jgi:hypothetical protein